MGLADELRGMSKPQDRFMTSSELEGFCNRLVGAVFVKAKKNYKQKVVEGFFSFSNWSDNCAYDDYIELEDFKVGIFGKKAKSIHHGFEHYLYNQDCFLKHYQIMVPVDKAKSILMQRLQKEGFSNISIEIIKMETCWDTQKKRYDTTFAVKCSW